MRNFKFSMPLAALFMISMAFTACQKDNIITEATKPNRFFIEDCCISAYPSSAEQLYTQTVTWGGQNQNQNTVTITAYNDDVATYVTVTNTSNAGAGMTIREAVPGINPTQTNGGTVYTANSPGSYTRTILHNEGWACGDAVTVSFYVSGLGGGNVIQTGILSNSLKALCAAAVCEDTFSADLDCSDDPKVLTVTFIAAEAGDYVLQGGLTAGTTIIDAQSEGLTQNTTHPGVQNSNANVTRWEGYIEACQTVTVSISYTGGNGVGDWSAKLGDVTKGASEDQDCN